MIFKVICFLFGGFWGIRLRIKKTNFSPKKQILIWIYSSYLEEKYCYIGYNTQFSSRVTFPHGFYGIFISNSAKIGKNCTIFHNVTIGSNTLPDSKNLGSPKIGNNVFIGAGATIIGGITIGDNCRIGANVTVSRDVPSDCLVITEKPEIIHKEKMNNQYYANTEEGWIYFYEGISQIETDSNRVELLNSRFNNL